MSGKSSSQENKDDTQQDSIFFKPGSRRDEARKKIKSQVPAKRSRLNAKPSIVEAKRSPINESMNQFDFNAGNVHRSSAMPLNSPLKPLTPLAKPQLDILISKKAILPNRLKQPTPTHLKSN